MAVPLRVVDISVWIEWLTGSALGKELPDKSQWIVRRAFQRIARSGVVPKGGRSVSDRMSTAFCARRGTL
jgi:hypothetical protein